MLSNPSVRQSSLPSGPPPAPARGRRSLSLRRLLGRKQPHQLISEPGVDHLLAFASESVSRTESIRPVVLKKKAPSPRRIGIWHLAVTFVITVLLSGWTIVAVRRLFLLPLAASAPATGNLTVNTRPDGSEVLVDGERRGVTPLALALASGSHTLMVRGAGNERVVPLTIAAGAEINHYFEMKAPDVPVRAKTPIKVASTSRPVPKQRVTTAASEPPIDPPKVAVSINVRPWAEVFIDGRSVGQTPIGNLLVAIGSHEVVFRHPDLGERKQTIVVSVSGPNRFATDFSK